MVQRRIRRGARVGACARRCSLAAALVGTAAVILVPSGAVAYGGATRAALPARTPLARWTIVATLVRPAPRYKTATSTRAYGTIPLTWRGAASVLPVLRATSTRLLVRLAQRPNGRKVWIPSRDATLSRTPYEIVIHLRSTHLMLFWRGRRIMSTPIGVGTRQNPTPKGAFFVAFFAMPPSPDYGPFVIVTSAHSNTITNWNYSGDAMVAIHGPLGADKAIGTTGARVSHGCVRLHLDALRRLRRVPAGSPIYIVS
jgi:lipoprotein-anchoring transpeptidase ErfK/SrfK